MAIDASLRAAVLIAWAGKCFYCGHDACCVDHIVPRNKRGTDAPHNLVACCWDCNRAKGELWLPLDVLNEALVAAQALAAQVLQIAAVHRNALKLAMDRVNYGSCQIREGTPGQALIRPGVRQRRPARDLAAEAAEIASRFRAQNVEACQKPSPEMSGASL